MPRFKSDIKGPVGGTVFFGIFFILGSIFFLLLSKQIYQENISYLWATGLCKINHVNLSYDFSSDSPYKLNVSYQLISESANNQEKFLNSNQFQKSFTNFKNAKLLEQKFVKNNQVVCYYDSKDIQQNTLVRGGEPWLILAIFLPLIFIFVGLGGIIFSWKSKGREQGSRISKQIQPIPMRFKIFMIILSLTGFLLSGYFLIYNPYQKLTSSADWKRVSAKVVKSTIDVNKGDDSTTYEPIIFYEYFIDGQRYFSNQINFFSYSSSNYNYASSLTKTYYLSRQIEVFYNPKDPFQAVIEAKVPKLLYFLSLLPFIFLIPFFIIFKTSPKVSRDTYPGLSEGSALPNWQKVDSKSSLTPTKTGLYKLTQDSSPLGRFIGLLIFSIIWNGILLVMFGDAPLVVIIIFGIIGLIVLSFTFYNFLQIFNPKLGLEISEPRIKVGGEYRLYWSLERTSKKITNLTIDLELEEQATYRRGTNSYTDRKIVYKKSLLVHDANLMIRQGEIVWDIPKDLMHSFSATNNKIIYRLVCHLQIARSADVKETYSITVFPN